MKEMKLVRLLKTFSKKEWKEFEKFASSAYFNNGRDYIPLVKELKKFSPTFESEKLTKEFIYSKLFPGRPCKPTVINSMSSALYALAKDFLVHQDLKKDKQRKLTVLTREISLKGLKKEADLMINNILINYKNKKIGFYDYYEKYLFYEEIHDHYFINDERKKLHQAIEQSNLFLVRYYLHMLIQAENQLLSTVNFSTQNYLNSSFGDILKHTNFEKMIAVLERDSTSDIILLKIYYYLLLANKHPNNDNYYFKAKILISDNYEQLDQDLKNRCYINLLGICTSKALEGNIKWTRESFDIYKIILMEKLYYYTGENLKFMPRRIFRNVISVSISIEETEWTKHFINDYLDELEPKYRETLYNYGMAKVEFNYKNYDKALYHINFVTQDQLIYKIEMKNLQSKIYYETNSVEPLFSLLDTYLHLINNSGIANVALIKRHENYIKFLKSIVKIKVGNKETIELADILKNIEKQKYINSKSWLIKKINELKSLDIT
ncbi:MAG TPA: hypothetical protein VG961_02740 [Ignavibacteria bacterium]|nr:hypothetical protein [Ignavibacteria bacterium]